MLDAILTDEEETWNNKVAVLPMDAKNTTNRTYDQWGNSEENGNYKENYNYNQKKKAESSGMHNEKRRQREFNTHRTWEAVGKSKSLSGWQNMNKKGW